MMGHHSATRRGLRFWTSKPIWLLLSGTYGLKAAGAAAAAFFSVFVSLFVA